MVTKMSILLALALHCLDYLVLLFVDVCANPNLDAGARPRLLFVCVFGWR
jgi:hypothetical protein